jgi:hypothetical protein
MIGKGSQDGEQGAEIEAAWEHDIAKSVAAYDRGEAWVYKGEDVLDARRLGV